MAHERTDKNDIGTVAMFVFKYVELSGTKDKFVSFTGQGKTKIKRSCEIVKSL